MTSGASVVLLGHTPRHLSATTINRDYVTITSPEQNVLITGGVSRIIALIVPQIKEIPAAALFVGLDNVTTVLGKPNPVHVITKDSYREV